MRLEITKQMVEAIGIAKLKPFGVTDEKIRYDTMALDLTDMNNASVRELNALIVPAYEADKKLKGALAAKRDLAM